MKSSTIAFSKIMRYTLIMIVFQLLGFFANAQLLNQADWQQEVNYKIHVKLIDSIHTITGHIEMEYINNSPNELSKIFIHLWPNAYKNNETAFAKQMVENRKLDFQYSKPQARGSITDIAFAINGQEVSYNYYYKHLDIAEIILPKPLKSGERMKISTPFTVRIPELFSRMGREDEEYYLTQWYPKPAVYDVNGWNPMPYLDQGEFYSEFGTFEVKIEVPANYLVAATGVLQEQEAIAEIQERIDNPISWDSLPITEKTYKTLTYKAEKVHDFAWFASKQYNILHDTVAIDDGIADVYIFAKNPNPENIQDVKNALTYYSEHVGNYPYPHATVVHGGLKAGGGMEYPMITICASMDAHTVVHEVGHNWFYGILATNERMYPWMDESINSFYDSRAAKSKMSINGLGMGKLSTFVHQEQALTSHQQHVGCKSHEFTNLNYGMIVYMLGPYYFNYLEAYLGEDLFKECMKTYFDEWKFKHPLPHDMKNVFERVANRNLSWFFDDVISSNKEMDYQLYTDKNGVVHLKNVGEIEGPIPVHLGEYSTEWRTVKLGESDSIGNVKSVPKPFWAIDSRGISPDFNTNNNTLKRKFALKPLSHLGKPTERHLYYLPAFGWNRNDGLMAGLMFHNYQLVSKKVDFFATPMYGIASNQLTGIGNITFTQGLQKQGSYFQLGMDVRRFSELRNPLSPLMVSYNKFKPYVHFYLPKKSLRTSADRKIGLDFHSINFQNQFDIDEQQNISKNPNFNSALYHNFLVLNYEVKQNRAINAYYWLLELEQAFTKNRINRAARDTATNEMIPIGEDFTTNNHTKLTTIFKYNLDIGIKKRPLKMRFYGSYFLTDPADGLFNFRIGGNGGANDYRRDNLMMNRFAQTGLFSRQVTDDKEFSKFVGLLSTPAQWMWNFNATLPLPGKIPVAPFVELLSFNDLQNVLNVDLMYMVGLQITIIPNIFEVYLNLNQTQAYTDFMERSPANNITRFQERITFKLKLDNLRPLHLKKQLMHTTSF